MSPPKKFLVIDDNDDARFLITKTLIRKFPTGVIQECQDADTSIAIAREGKVDAIIVHRGWETDAKTLIRQLREVSPTVPIIAVSGLDRAKETLAAGATRFHSYDEWLRIGTVVGEVLGMGQSTPPLLTDDQQAVSAPV